MRLCVHAKILRHTAKIVDCPNDGLRLHCPNHTTGVSCGVLPRGLEQQHKLAALVTMPIIRWHVMMLVPRSRDMHQS